MNTAFLITHIIGASLLGIVIVLSFVSIFTNASNFYKKLLYSLCYGLGLQTVTGSLLELSSPHAALFVVFCSKILFYLLAVVLTQVALLVKMYKSDMKVSTKYIFYSVGFTALTVAITGFFLA